MTFFYRSPCILYLVELLWDLVPSSITLYYYANKILLQIKSEYTSFQTIISEKSPNLGKSSINPSIITKRSLLKYIIYIYDLVLIKSINFLLLYELCSVLRSQESCCCISGLSWRNDLRNLPFHIVQCFFFDSNH